MGVKCFMLEPVPKIRIWLRRYSSSPSGAEAYGGGEPGGGQPPRECPGPYRYHDAKVFLMDTDCPLPEIGQNENWLDLEAQLRPENSDERWSKKCDHCDYHFTDEDQWQMFTHRLYKRQDNGELTTLREAPGGAMWFATWYRRDDGNYGWDWDNQTEPPLCVKTPCGNDWLIDSRCNNCPLPQDRIHRCWVRQGTPPNITVGKGGGPTCPAGGGSIQVPGGGHYMLESGEFRNV